MKWNYFKWTRNRTKKAIKNKVEERNKNVMKEIEKLKTSNPKAYWNKLRKLSKSNNKKKTWETAIDKDGVEVAGTNIKLVWKETYEELGKENITDDEFDCSFVQEVNKEVEQMERKSEENNKINYL